MLVTVNGSAANCRPRHAKLTLKYKHAATASEKQEAGSDYTDLYDTHPYLNITEWGVNDIQHDIQWLGLTGSPTKVKKIDSVVLKGSEIKLVQNNDEAISKMVHELIADHTLG